MATNRNHAQRLEALQSIMREDYGQDLSLSETAEIADWLVQFYTALIKLAAQRRVAERDAAKLKASLLAESNQ